MSDIIPNVVVSMPSQLFTLARKFQAASNGKIYIGKIDTDPTLPENQIQVYLEGEDGSHIPVPQPLIINQAGFPVYSGQIAKFVTVEGHSMAVYDSYGSQQHYFPNILKYDPDMLEQRLASETGSSLVGIGEGLTLADALSNRIYPGGDAAKKLREVLDKGLSPLFMNGTHFFESTVKDVDDNDCFALIPSNTTIHTESKSVQLRPSVQANSFFSPKDSISTDIYLHACTAFGVAINTNSPRIVNKFLPAGMGDESRIVRFNMNAVNMVDFDNGFDSYTWSNNLTNTDAGWCDIGYNFRKGSAAPTSYRMIGTGATSCNTSYVIERATYSVMLNPFSDDSDLGIHVKEAKGLAIIQPGFEHCKQLAIIGTDHWSSTTQGVNWIGSFCYRRWRSGKVDSIDNFSDWGVEIYRTFESSFDFSGIDYEWVKRNKINFIKLKSCFNINIDGIPPESIYVDPDGDSTYDDISLGKKCRNRVSDFYINNINGDDKLNGSKESPLASFSKLNFVLPSDFKSRRRVFVDGNVNDRLILKNKKSSYYDKNSNINTLSISGNKSEINGLSLFNINMGDSGLSIDGFSISLDSHIESSSGFNLSNITLKEGSKLYISSSSGYIGNLIMETGSQIICTKGTQLKLGVINGGKIESNSSIVYTNNDITSTEMVKRSGGQIF